LKSIQQQQQQQQIVDFIKFELLLFIFIFLNTIILIR